jgi:hypothetical protein
VADGPVPATVGGAHGAEIARKVQACDAIASPESGSLLADPSKVRRIVSSSAPGGSAMLAVGARFSTQAPETQRAPVAHCAGDRQPCGSAGEEEQATASIEATANATAQNPIRVELGIETSPDGQ